MKDEEKLKSIELRVNYVGTPLVREESKWLIKKVRSLYKEIEGKFDIARDLGKLEATQEYISEDVRLRIEIKKLKDEALVDKTALKFMGGKIGELETEATEMKKELQVFYDRKINDNLDAYYKN